jgi:uncharacterized protein with PQ loop repeat
MLHLFSLLATLISVAGLVPQVVKAWRYPQGSSYAWVLTSTLATAIWTVHGYVHRDWFVFGSNVGMLTCFLAILLIRMFRRV